MTTLVYQFGCRMSREDRARVTAEMELGRKYYNALIDKLNLWLAGEKGPDGKRTGGFAKEAEGAVAWLYRDSDILEQKKKALTAKLIYRSIRSATFAIRKDLKAGESGCYKGTYDDVCSDFDRATSDKRKGVWPGEPFRYRGPRETTVGCRTIGNTWGYLQSGKSKICSIGPLRKGNGSSDEKYFDISLRVTKEGEPIHLSVSLGRKQHGVRRQVPIEAEISRVRLIACGDYATGGKFVLQVTAKLPDADAPRDISERVGIDVGWEELSDGSILVAETSNGETLVIPEKTVRQAKRVEELQSLRDTNKSLILDVLKKAEIPCLAKSASQVTNYCETRGIHGVGSFLETEHNLRCTQEHCRRRYQNIRDDIYKKFASKIGVCAAILKLNRKSEAEGESKRQEVNHTRQIASTFILSQCLRNKGAIEVQCERVTDSIGPRRENAERIREAAAQNLVLVRPARRAVRKYRKAKVAA